MKALFLCLYGSCLIGCCSSISVDVMPQESTLSSRAVSYSSSSAIKDAPSSEEAVTKADMYRATQLIQAYKKAHPQTINILAVKMSPREIDAEIAKRHLRTQSRAVEELAPAMRQLMEQESKQ